MISVWWPCLIYRYGQHYSARCLKVWWFHVTCILNELQQISSEWRFPRPVYKYLVYLFLDGAHKSAFKKKKKWFCCLTDNHIKLLTIPLEFLFLHSGLCRSCIYHIFNHSPTKAPVKRLLCYCPNKIILSRQPLSALDPCPQEYSMTMC